MPIQVRRAAAIPMDYLVVGSNGFAQVGDPDYFTKAKIELRILFEFLQVNYPVPDEFASNAYYYIKAFNHDFDAYHEVVVIFDDQYLSTLADSEISNGKRIIKCVNCVIYFQNCIMFSIDKVFIFG